MHTIVLFLVFPLYFGTYYDCNIEKKLNHIDFI